VKTSASVVAAILILAAVPAVADVQEDLAQAVFMLETVERDGAHYKRAGYGTAFFVAPDGTALTNSHVVYRAQREPDRYMLLAIVDKEFYSVTVTCASRLTFPESQETRPERDVAQIKVIPAAFPFETWGYTFKTGEHLTVATAHRGGLPEFPTLTVADRYVDGEHVRVLGYGHISPIASKWMATGFIAETERASDGTEVLTIRFTNPAQPGNSGSPVLNDHDHVIGLATWYSGTEADLGFAQSNSVLQNPCR
jgi:V8-like Glu-specific endopeptidase